MVDFNPALPHDLLQITVGNRIPDIEKHRVQDDVFRIVATLEVNRHSLIPTHKYKAWCLSQLGNQAHALKLCDKTQSSRSETNSTNNSPIITILGGRCMVTTVTVPGRRQHPS